MLSLGIPYSEIKKQKRSAFNVCGWVEYTYEVGGGQEAVEGQGLLDEDVTGRRVDVEEGGGWVVAHHLITDHSLKYNTRHG